MLWHMESQRGHYRRAKEGLNGLRHNGHAELCDFKVRDSAKLSQSFKMTSKNGILDSISSLLSHLVSADFKKLLPKGVFLESATNQNSFVHQLQNGPSIPTRQDS